MSDSAPTGWVILGWISTPYASASDCPRQPWRQTATSIIDMQPEYLAVIEGLEVGMRVHVLWLAHLANRRLHRRRPTHDADPLGVFAGRGVDRPNPIGLTLVEIKAIESARIAVRGMDCVDGTPLLDLKPAIPIPDQCMQ